MRGARGLEQLLSGENWITGRAQGHDGHGQKQLSLCVAEVFVLFKGQLLVLLRLAVPAC